MEVFDAVVDWRVSEGEGDRGGGVGLGSCLRDDAGGGEGAKKTNWEDRWLDSTGARREVYQ